MRQVMHVLSAAVFLLLGSAGKPIRSKREPALRSGAVDLLSKWLPIITNIARPTADHAAKPSPPYSSIVSRTRSAITAGSSSSANTKVRSNPCGPVIMSPALM
jgi:hypothetical protein